jgi:hypothetical protein
MYVKNAVMSSGPNLIVHCPSNRRSGTLPRIGPRRKLPVRHMSCSELKVIMSFSSKLTAEHVMRNPTLVDKVMRFMPGYTGYNNRDERRQSDAQVRARVCAALEQCEEILAERHQLELDRHQALRAHMADDCGARLLRLREELAQAPIRSSALLDAESLSLSTLDELARHDLELLEAVIRLAERVSELTWQELGGTINRLEQAVAARSGFVHTL